MGTLGTGRASCDVTSGNRRPGARSQQNGAQGTVRSRFTGLARGARESRTGRVINCPTSLCRNWESSRELYSVGPLEENTGIHSLLCLCLVGVGASASIPKILLQNDL